MLQVWEIITELERIGCHQVSYFIFNFMVEGFHCSEHDDVIPDSTGTFYYSIFQKFPPLGPILNGISPIFIFTLSFCFKKFLCTVTLYSIKMHICSFWNEIGRACNMYVRDKRCMQGFGGETWEEQQLVRPRRRWEDNIKMDLWDVGWEGMDWIDLAQDRDSWRVFVNAVMNLRVP